MFDRDLIDALLKQADIVAVISSYLNVIQKGRNFLAVCPFHDDKNPSLNISKEKQIYKCFACGAGGNAITFVERYEKISFEAAVRKVADLCNFHDPRLQRQGTSKPIDPNKKRLYDCIDDLEQFYVYARATEEASKANEYLKKRNIPLDQIEKFGIGYAPLDGAMTVRYLQKKGHSLKTIQDIGIAFSRAEGTSDRNAGRLIFPLRNPSGQLVGFSARQLEKDGTSKYINTQETPIFHKGDNLFNYHNAAATAHRDGYCYVLEGFMDVMALDRIGIPDAVALCGTALTAEQISLLRRLRCELRLCLDGDAPGQMGMMKMINQLTKAEIPFRVVYNPGDLRDPDDILQEDGEEALKEAMSHLVGSFDFQIGYYIHFKKLETSEDRQRVLNAFLPNLRLLKPGIEQEDGIAKLSKATGYETAAIRELVNRARPGETTEEEAIYVAGEHFAIAHPERKWVRRLDQAEKAILRYMLTEKQAVDFYERKKLSFYNPLYEEVAQYAMEVAERNHDVDPSNIIAEIEVQGPERADELVSDVSRIADEFALPFDLRNLEASVKIIEEERPKVKARNDAEKAQSETPESKQAIDALGNLFRRKGANWGSKKDS